MPRHAWAEMTAPALFHAAAHREDERRDDPPALLTTAQTGEWKATKYKQLAAAARRVATAIKRSTAGGSPLVGVCLPRGRALAVAVLAVHQAGAGYVPLDPSYPRKRLMQYAADAQLQVVVTTHATRDAMTAAADDDNDNDAQVWRAIRWVTLREGDGGDDLRDDGSPEAPPSVAQRDPAYCIFTSGSTGRPKGVVISHRNLIGHLSAMQADVCQLDAASRDVLFAVTTISFDIHALELHLPWIMRCTVALAPDGIARDGRRWLRSLAATSATVVQAVPAAWDILANAAADDDTETVAYLRLGLCGGEAMLYQLAAKLMVAPSHPRVPLVARLVNVYGPTEATVWCAFESIDRDALLPPHLPKGVVPIGRALRNYELFVVDGAALDRDEPMLVNVGKGLVGELVVAGVGVADEGYLEASDVARSLNASRFLRVGPTRIYRTGDAASVDVVTNKIHFHGRLDGQVKVRGFRVEVGEVEAAALAVLQSSPDNNPLLKVADAKPQSWAVAADARGARLVLWVSASGPQLGDVPRDEREGFARFVRERVAERLPEHMVPSAVVCVAGALPTTLNGKVDRKALVLVDDLDDGGCMSPRGGAPRGATEMRIMDLWTDLLRGAGREGGGTIHTAAGTPAACSDTSSDSAKTAESSSSSGGGSLVLDKEKGREGTFAIGRDADFRADLGGTSLLETELQRRLERAFGVSLPPGFCASRSTIAAQARALGEAATTIPLRRLPLPCYVAEHQPDPRAFLAELHRATPPYLPRVASVSAVLAPPVRALAWVLRLLSHALTAIIPVHRTVRSMRLRPRTLDARTRELLRRVPLDADSAYLSAMPITRCLCSTAEGLSSSADDVEAGGQPAALSPEEAERRVLDGLQAALDAFPSLANKLDADLAGRLFTTCEGGFVAVDVEHICASSKSRARKSWLSELGIPGAEHWSVPAPHRVALPQWAVSFAFFLNRVVFHVLLCHVVWLPTPQLRVHVRIEARERRAVALAVAVTYPHSLGDETTGDELWRAWARACRGEALDENAADDDVGDLNEWQEVRLRETHNGLREHLGAACTLWARGSTLNPSPSAVRYARVLVTRKQLAAVRKALGDCDDSAAVATLALAAAGGGTGWQVSFIADLRTARPHLGLAKAFANGIAYTAAQDLEVREEGVACASDGALADAVGAANAAALLAVAGAAPALARARARAAGLSLVSPARLGAMADVAGRLLLVNDVSHFEAAFNFGPLGELHSNTSDGLLGVPAANRMCAEEFLDSANIADADLATCLVGASSRVAATVTRAPEVVGGGVVISMVAGLF